MSDIEALGIIPEIYSYDEFLKKLVGFFSNEYLLKRDKMKKRYMTKKKFKHSKNEKIEKFSKMVAYQMWGGHLRGVGKFSLWFDGKYLKENFKAYRRSRYWKAIGNSLISIVDMDLMKTGLKPEHL